MESFAPVPALIGGVLIGLSAVALMALNGRIAGIAGIIGALPDAGAAEFGWRLAFIVGLITGPVAVLAVGGALPAIMNEASWPALITGGLLVGFGTRFGNGCTSGHGVCGVARLSPRSLVATATFTAAAMITVVVVRHGLGG